MSAFTNLASAAVFLTPPPPPVYLSQPPLQVLPAEQLPGFPPATHEGSSSVPTRKQCIVEGCLARVAPSMWHNHMSLHAKGALPGEVPSYWMKNQNLFICPICSQLVSCSCRALHHSHCRQRQSTRVLPKCSSHFDPASGPPNFQTGLSAESPDPAIHPVESKASFRQSPVICIARGDSQEYRRSMAETFYAP